MRSRLVPYLALAVAISSVAACATMSGGQAGGPRPGGADPRVGLRAGSSNAGEAAWNLRLVSNTPVSETFRPFYSEGRFSNSDLAFKGSYVFQGNYSGFQVWDVSNPSRPRLVAAHVCPGSQNDVSVYGDLLFLSVESPAGRVDCGTQGVADSVSAERFRGVRIFDIRDVARPRLVTNVQTCRGSHTHTVVTDPDDTENVYVYISGSAPVRSPSELAGCSAAPPEEDSNSAQFRIDIIKVPLAAPEQASVVGGARFLAGLAPVERHPEVPADSIEAERRRAELERQRAAAGQPVAPRPAGPPRPRTGPTNCHDITVYPEMGLGGGACGGYGILLDIREVTNPTRIDQVADPNFAFWHSATFNNDGTKILFSDEWGGGGQPRCRATDRPEWGADAIFTLDGTELTFESYYKLPAAQTPFENCVAHNGSLVPIPGRDVMVQGWYQGGISVFDWTDPDNPTEIAFFDRGPMDSTRMVAGGSWSAYWYNGAIISSEISRGLDILELTPSEHLTRNEIDAAKLVRLDHLNVQSQPKLVWPPSFVVARAYLDQIERSRGLTPDRISDIRRELGRAEFQSGEERRQTLTRLAAQLDDDAAVSGDATGMRRLATAVRDLGDAGR